MKNVEVGDHVSCGVELDELVTKTYDLDDINEGYRAMRDGENIRGVITYG